MAEDNNDIEPFKTDTESLHSYVYKKIEIIMNNKSSYSGWVYTIDPESKTVVLLDIDSHSIELVTSHSIKGIRILNSDTNSKKDEIDELIKMKKTNENSKKKLRKIEDVISYFNRHRIPVQREGDKLLVAGIVNVSSPYTEDDCESTNPMALANIQKFLNEIDQTGQH